MRDHSQYVICPRPWAKLFFAYGGYFPHNICQIALFSKLYIQRPRCRARCPGRQTVYLKSDVRFYFLQRHGPLHGPVHGYGFYVSFFFGISLWRKCAAFLVRAFVIHSHPIPGQPHFTPAVRANNRFFFHVYSSHAAAALSSSEGSSHQNLYVRP